MEGKLRNARRIFVGNRKGKDHSEDLSVDGWEDIIKMYFKEIWF
jgi:hypothetical protein